MLQAEVIPTTYEREQKEGKRFGEGGKGEGREIFGNYDFGFEIQQQRHHVFMRKEKKGENYLISTSGNADPFAVIPPPRGSAQPFHT